MVCCERVAVPWQRLKSAKVSWSSSEKVSMNRSLKTFLTQHITCTFFMKLIGHDHQIKNGWCFCWTWLILGTVSNDHYSEYHFEAWQGEVAETSIVEHPVLIAQSLNFWQNDIVINIIIFIIITIIIIIGGRWKWTRKTWKMRKPGKLRVGKVPINQPQWPTLSPN